MRALIFAAGRGERMRPLSDVTAKPLLAAGGKRLIEWQIDALVRAGVRELVINTAHLCTAIEATLGDGSRFGARIAYSREGTRAEEALETLGGIVKALPLLAPRGADTPFLVVSGDIVTDYDYRRLIAHAQAIELGTADAHLVLVRNRPSHPGGDMGLASGRINQQPPLLTYANIGVFAPRLFRNEAAVRKKLFPWLYAFAALGRVTGEQFDGLWHNVSTPAELAQLDAALAARK
jgi:N-acetyl-alpha-D-muramate 1-phosphate uridylyltransferase